MLEGTDNTIRSHDDSKEGHRGDLATTCPLLSSGTEGVGVSEATLPLLLILLALPRPHIPTKHCPSSGCCWGKGCIGTGGSADTN